MGVTWVVCVGLPFLTKWQLGTWRCGFQLRVSGLEDVVLNEFINDDCIPEGEGQVASGSVSLPDPVAWVLETEEQMLEREQNERYFRDALGEYKCDAGMSVEDVSAIVNIKNTGWAVGVVKSVEKKQSVADRFVVKYIIGQKRIAGLKN